MDEQTFKFIHGLVGDFYDDEIGVACINDRTLDAKEYMKEKKETLISLEKVYEVYKKKMSSL